MNMKDNAGSLWRSIENLRDGILGTAILAGIGKLWGLSHGNIYLFLLAVVSAGTIAVLFFISIYKRVTWGSPRTSKHLKTLRADLNPLHPGVRPAVAFLAQKSAHNLLGEKGENITLMQYMDLINESLRYDRISDVTFIAATGPDAWASRKEIPALQEKEPDKAAFFRRLWEEYFDGQKNKKARFPHIRMRRIFLLKSEWDNNKDELTDLKDEHEGARHESTTQPVDRRKNLKDEHNEAHIDLIKLRPDEIPTEMQQDLALLISKDCRVWIIRSNYSSSHTTVDTWILHDHVDLSDYLARFFNRIAAVYDASDNKNLLAEYKGVKGKHTNQLDADLLIACNIWSRGE